MSDGSDSRSRVTYWVRRSHVRFDAGTEGAYAKSIKRVFDVVVASFCLLIFAPLIVILLLVVWRDGASPIYGHSRVGQNGSTFRCWKIRTMVPDAESRLIALLDSDEAAREQWTTQRKLDNDPRITAFGRFLRSSSLDELPQLWNVLVGEMSIVGPRPVTSDELWLYGDAAVIYRTMRPGVTGYWQTMGRGRVTYDERVQMDREYSARLSFLLDLKILFRTAHVVLARTGS